MDSLYVSPSDLISLQKFTTRTHNYRDAWKMFLLNGPFKIFQYIWVCTITLIAHRIKRECIVYCLKGKIIK